MSTIVTPFASKILVKDYDMPLAWTEELISTLKFLAANKAITCSLSKSLEDNLTADLLKYDTQKSTKPYVIHQQAAQEFKVIKDLRDIFLQGFLELNKHYDNGFSEEYLQQIYLEDSGNFAVLKKGERVGLHNHPSIGFAIFYLTDVDNYNDGGELVLHDPSFHRNQYFHPPREVRIQTKKNRLVIGAADVWHEVTPYTGNADRMCAVIDLNR
jgi:hypothetical protein